VILVGDVGEVLVGVAAIKLVAVSWGGEGGGDSWVLRCEFLSRVGVVEFEEGEGRGALGLGEKYWQLT
jgi:hypothetical protein